MKKITTGMAVASGLLALLAYFRGGTSLVLEGLQGGGLMLLKVTPLLLIAFLVAGFIQVMVSH